ncbi:non-canonical purine NTP pyrophosphatase [Candidatus Parcubacteria bacterium]|nr:non-canonical purine NTP pyrophosphatase [Candidatus Parcubacteria bacterium]MCG2701157.1 non-canonical purine NTP pyrophosphatase [Candidatus Parcubacteria bacterium]
MKEIIFITTNKHKVKEISAVLKEYNIKVKQLKMDYEENKEDSMEEVSKKAAKLLSAKLNKTVIVEDTGIFFNAYTNFPGALPKFIFNSIGFDGIFRLLKDKDRGVYCKTAIGYCEPGKKPKIFTGKIYGKITNKIIKPKKETMPYNHIFIPDGEKKAVVEMSADKWNSISQRGKASRKLGEFLVNR